MAESENQKSDNKLAKKATGSHSPWLWLLTLTLAVAFIGSGLFGHAPWKLHDMQTLETVQAMTESGDLVVPMRGGEPALTTPPLYYATAAALSQRLADSLPPRDAARLATGLFLALTLIFAGLLGRLTWKPTETKGVGATGAMTVLLLIGTLGVVWFGHDVVTDSALMAGTTMGLYGLLLLPRRILLGAPWLLIWPWLLHERDPQLFELWLWGNNIHQYLDHLAVSKPEHNLQWLWTFLIMAFPAWLLAGLALILRPGALFGLPGVRLALLFSVVGWAILISAEAARPIHAVLLLVPLAVIAVGGLTRMPGMLVLPLKWLSTLLFGLFAAASWGIWIYLKYQGQLPDIQPLTASLPADHTFQFQARTYLVAAALTVLWLWIVLRYRAPGPSALLAWPAGVVMSWSLLMLHQPWVDQLIQERGLIAGLTTEPPIVMMQTPQAAAGESAASATPAQSSGSPAAYPAPAMIDPQQVSPGIPVSTTGG